MEPTVEALKNEISYNPETGELHWIKPGLGRRKNKPAGSLVTGKQGGTYRRIMLNGHQLLAHRVAFALMTGNWPLNEIDHINGDGTDNRWINMREATRAQNLQNRRRPLKSNKTGLLGVWPTRPLADGTVRYIAQLQHNKRRHNLGTFGTPEEAHEAYLEAKRRLHEYNTL